MAAALHCLRNDTAQTSLYPRALMNDFEFGDNRYPTLSSQPKPKTSADDRSWDPSSSDSQSSARSFEAPKLSLSWASAAEQRTQPEPQFTARPLSRQDRASPDADGSSGPSDLQPDPQRASRSYALSPGASRRVVERYSLDDSNQRPPSRTSNDTKPTFVESVQDTVTLRNPGTPSGPRAISPPGRKSPKPSSSRRVPPATSAGASSSQTPQLSPFMPLSASPTYNPPVAPNHRAYAQQPTYVTQPNAPNPIQTVYTPIIPQQEEICVECAMRDQDMADVDVTSAGVWERASDVLFEELKQRELEDEANGVVVDNPSRPRIKGGRLTEQNIKLWLSINPREPASRQQTLNTYIKSQRTLLEAEALAHARAMQEAKQLDSRMRDAYSQLRRSAYDTGNSSSPADDLGGVRIKPPLSPGLPSHNHARSHSREITLLENGMIVEHVDVRKEEREARERKKRDDKRARKSSRSSVMDVTSIISAQSGGQLTENGLKPYSRYSHASSARPTSVLTAPNDRPDLPHAYSQASFSDVHSLGSSSPRRTRFFGMKNLSAGWRSQDSLAPSGVSGSMIDMHVALQREAYGAHPLTASPIDLNTPRRSQIWPPAELEDLNASHSIQEEKGKKKKGGLAKIWRIVTGKNDGAHRETVQRGDGQDDDLPLAPPPPLSYLVGRVPSDVVSGGMRSTPSLPSVVSPKYGLSTSGMSPPTAPSSMLPSPASLRPSGDIEIVDGRSANLDTNGLGDEHGQEAPLRRSQSVNWKPIHSAKSETELRSKSIATFPSPPLPVSNSNSLSPNPTNIPARSVISREKSLPPLPPDEQPARITPSDLARPRTVYAYDHRTLPPGSSPAHDFLPPQAPFRTTDVRRQSFGGTSSRPNLALQTMPTSRPVDFDSRRSFGPRYDEFGISRQSLGRLEHVQEHLLRTGSPLPSTKRKGKFGFSSLLGKKNDKREQEAMQENIGHQFPSMGYSPYDPQDDLTTNGYTNSVSRHSTFSSVPPNPNLRMSVTSRKALEELVQQDADFVAYRYPSNDQRLDLLR
ncbi:hypothetical protein M413DRAFT_446304 [Hebeloma cylindrosporum]|uniref:Proteophosphoglycan ppg4 n=1 Tax=Hebeloma cylindrosporum TaxID=76867 RepID=A0A0C3C9B6_HEBCY|nr:hypothetical protein M413DRAFT_446304 [Hebeloma cylindrosporum h7]